MTSVARLRGIWSFVSWRVVAALGGVCCLAASAFARVWEVNQDGTGDTVTIQAAVDSTSPGDTVLVRPGTYLEGVHATHEIALLGSGASTTVVDRNGEPGDCLRLTGRGSLIEGLRLVGTLYTGYGFNHGIAAYGTEIRDCELETALGMYLDGESTVHRCTFRGSSGIFFFPNKGNLVIEDCHFEACVERDDVSIVEIACNIGLCDGTKVSIRRTAFEGSVTYDGRPVVGYDEIGVPGGLQLLVEDCLFHQSGGGAVGFSPLPVVRAGGNPDFADVTLRRNTIVRSSGWGIGDPTGVFPISKNVALDANSVTGNRDGIALPIGVGPGAVTCNLVWGNGTNWSGIPDPTGQNGNTAAPPKYCGADVGDFSVAQNSPLLPLNNPCGVQIGAFGQGCGELAVESSSWGRIKGLYRE